MDSKKVFNQASGMIVSAASFVFALIGVIDIIAIFMKT